MKRAALDIRKKTRTYPSLPLTCMLMWRQPFVSCTVPGMNQNMLLSQHIWEPCERSQGHHSLHVLCNGNSRRMVKPYRNVKSRVGGVDAMPKLPRSLWATSPSNTMDSIGIANEKYHKIQFQSQMRKIIVWHKHVKSWSVPMLLWTWKWNGVTSIAYYMHIYAHLPWHFDPTLSLTTSNRPHRKREFIYQSKTLKFFPPNIDTSRNSRRSC